MPNSPSFNKTTSARSSGGCRDTALSLAAAFGAKRHVGTPHRARPGDVGSPRYSGVDSSRRVPGSPAARTHVMFEDGTLVAKRDLHRHPEADSIASALSPRGKPLVRHVNNVGGTDSVYMGTDDTVYTCGVKEAHMRVALTDAAARSVLASPVAGTRPVRTHAIAKPRSVVGGEDHVSSDVFTPVLDAAVPAFTESVATAQQKSVLDVDARAAATAQTRAGSRVAEHWLGTGKRTSQPSGGTASFRLEWAVPSGRSEVPAPHAPLSRVREEVGGFSAPYLAPAPPAAHTPRAPQDSSVMGNVLQMHSSDVSGAAMARPSTARSRLLRDQPLGGRVLAEQAGISGLDNASSAMIGARQASARPATASTRLW